MAGGLDVSRLCWLERTSYRAADHVITVNDSLKQTACTRGGLPRRPSPWWATGRCSLEPCGERRDQRSSRPAISVLLVGANGSTRSSRSRVARY
jgi:hypothetical protein